MESCSRSPSRLHIISMGSITRIHVFFGGLYVGWLDIFMQAPTWTFLRVVLLALAASLLFMLSVAANISGLGTLLHVLFLILVAVSLFVLLNW